MKRVLSLILALVMLTGLMSACSSSALSSEEKVETATEEQKETAKEKRDPTGFAAGYASIDINPTSPTGMAGYGNTSYRRSSTVANDLIASCTAISDGENIALFYSADVLGFSRANVDAICKQVEKALGIPPEMVVLSATHCHSGPAVASTDESVTNYQRTFYPKMVQLAKDAVADLDRCEMKIGTGYTENLSYVRRYYREDGTFTGVNYLPDSGSPIARHETEVDNEMQLLLLDRVNGKDILMVNWQCHVTSAGGVENTVIDSDWTGSMRREIEKEGLLFSYHQGGAGNVVPNSSISSEPNNSDFLEHGRKIAKVALEALPTLKAVPSGKVRGIQKEVECPHERDQSTIDPAKAAEVQKYYLANDRDTATKLCLEYGFNSIYHANSYANRAKRAPSSKMIVGAVAVGDIGFVVAPYEMFDTNGMQIKDGAPYTMTFVCAYSNGSQGYIPSSVAWPNGGYEVDTCVYQMGTGEMLANEMIGLLEQLK